MPLNTILLSLCCKVDFIWTCAVQLVIAQSLQFSQISKKPAIEFRQFFCYRQESLFLFNLEKKWVHRARFCGSIAEVHITCKFISNNYNVHARWKLKFTCKYRGSNRVKMELNFCDFSDSKQDRYQLWKASFHVCEELKNYTHTAYVMHILKTARKITADRNF